MLIRLGSFWVFLIIFILGVIYLPGAAKYIKLKRKENELSRQIANLQSEIKKLQNEEHLLKTDLNHLEQEVRKVLGLVKPGEIVVKVIEEEVPSPAAQTS